LAAISRNVVSNTVPSVTGQEQDHSQFTLLDYLLVSKQ